METITEEVSVYGVSTLNPHLCTTRTGYLHPSYAESLSEFGVPVELTDCGAMLLKRTIAGTDDCDLMGCYPLFCCENPASLQSDLDQLREQFVAVSLVFDPFADCDETFLRRCFDVAIPFKTHYVADLEKPIESFTSATHRKFGRRAQRQLCIEVVSSPVSKLDDWMRLYGELIRRHDLKGIRAFSRQAFERQLQIPGTVLFSATHEGEVVGLDWWFVQGDVAQGHLAATNEHGYEMHAAYGLKLAILEYFKGKVRWLNFGGAAGVNDSASNGLAAFKRGWTSEERTAWFCGSILNQEKYDSIVSSRNLPPTRYFPAYRQGEFA